MYKVGDLVRVIDKDGYIPYGTILKIKIIDENGTITTNNGSRWFNDSKLLEPVTHLTTKEFIKLVEDMGYELDIRTGVIFIKTKNYREVGWVRTDYECSAAFNFECDKSLLDIFYLYANTPLELREEKEQLYTLELPNNKHKNRFYCHQVCSKNYSFGKLNPDVNRQPDHIKHFTQKEIDELPNQELIKTLIKKEVKE